MRWSGTMPNSVEVILDISRLDVVDFLDDREKVMNVLISKLQQ